MIVRNISCTHCGQRGIMEYPDMSDNMSIPAVFRHLGHNPWSGNIYYQCPSCRTILLVDPSDVLGSARGIDESIGYHQSKETRI